MAWLTCGCCGDWFRGEPDPDHDTGFGHCPRCVDWIRDTFEEPMWDRLREAVEASLSPENLERFLAMDADLQRAIISKAIDEGQIRWEVKR
jgi:hypothetical protein